MHIEQDVTQNSIDIGSGHRWEYVGRIFDIGLPSVDVAARYLDLVALDKGTRGLAICMSSSRIS
jgi:hypothetical protein